MREKPRLDTAGQEVCIWETQALGPAGLEVVLPGPATPSRPRWAAPTDVLQVDGDPLQDPIHYPLNDMWGHPTAEG